MSASDEFPRGITLTNSSAFGAQASITLPACPGLAWVLTSVVAQQVLNAASAGGNANNINANGTILAQAYIAAGAVANSTTPSDWEGKIPFPVNTAVVITFFQALPNVQEFLSVTGYVV